MNSLLIASRTHFAIDSCIMSPVEAVTRIRESEIATFGSMTRVHPGLFQTRKLVRDQSINKVASTARISRTRVVVSYPNSGQSTKIQDQGHNPDMLPLFIPKVSGTDRDK